jgi:flagellar hook-associated protein 2
MAVSSTSSSTSRAGSTLDVAGIVSGLMEAENVPVNKLDNKISKSSVKITALGAIKSQLSTLKSSLIDLQTPANFSKQAAKFSNTSVAIAEITATAAAASYQMEVTSLAQPTIWNVSGFTTSAAALAWYNDSAQSAVKTSADATVLQTSTNVFVLSLKSKTSGTSGAYSIADSSVASGQTLATVGSTSSVNTLTFASTTGLVAGMAVSGTGIPAGTTITSVNSATGITLSASATVSDAASLTFTAINKVQYQAAQDAVFKLNGVTFTRSSNAVTDALTGVTLNLTSTTAAATPITLTVSNDPVSARPKLDAMVKAYNDLYALYKQQTASSLDVATRGVLNSDFGVSSMMRQLISGLMLPTKDSTGVAFLTGETDLSAMGLKLLDNGTLAVDDTLLASASSTLQTRLAAGIRIGYSSALSSDLSNQIGDMILSGGVIQDRIESETSLRSDLAKRKTTLQEKLVSVQARYIAQYASLDALLFKLQGTSDSLKSALDGLTNSQKNG